MAIEVKEHTKQLLFPQSPFFWRLVNEYRETVNLPDLIRRAYITGYKWGWCDREKEAI
jgi:hypothetical protein